MTLTHFNAPTNTPITIGARRFLQDGRTVVTVTALDGNTVEWEADDGTTDATSRQIFRKATTPAPSPQAVA